MDIQNIIWMSLCVLVMLFFIITNLVGIRKNPDGNVTRHTAADNTEAGGAEPPQ